MSRFYSWGAIPTFPVSPVSLQPLQTPEGSEVSKPSLLQGNIPNFLSLFSPTWMLLNSLFSPLQSLSFSSQDFPFLIFLH